MENLKIGKFSTLGLDKLPTHNVVAQKMDTIEFDKFPVSEAEAEPDANAYANANADANANAHANANANADADSLILSENKFLKQINSELLAKVDELTTRLHKYTNGDNHKRYYEKNKEKIKQSGATYLQKLKTENPDKIKAYSKQAYANKKKKLLDAATMTAVAVTTQPNGL